MKAAGDIGGSDKQKNLLIHSERINAEAFPRDFLLHVLLCHVFPPLHLL